MEISNGLELEIQLFLKKKLSVNTKVIGLTPLPGDASERRYFRVRTEGPEDSDQNSFILMKSFKPESELVTFLDVHRALEKLGVAVPQLFHSNIDSGFLLEEDCGDVTLENCVKKQNEKEIESLYQKAVDVLITMQFTKTHGPTSCVAYHRFFDTEKFLYELDFMRTHLLIGLTETTPTDRDTIEMSSGFKLLSNELSNEPRVFTHRDYHSRNIMVQGEDEQLKLLDFQDARMGPCQYDLVSLLRDSYSPLTTELTDKLMTYYLNRAAERGVHFDEVRFRKIFDYMTVQRSLKAAGTFAFQKVKKKNDNYSIYLKPVLKMATECMEKHSELDVLKSCLLRYVAHLL